MPAEVVLRVDPATAKAYEEASPEEKERARSAFERSLAEQREKARAAAAAELIRVMNDMAREARARGLTPEILEEILNEAPPSDETSVGKSDEGASA